MTQEEHLTVAIIGAGFSGLYALHECRELGVSVQVFEAAPDIGGTWYWNCYPGARCDIESNEYRLSAPELADWQWNDLYAVQPEILRYIHFIADRWDLRKDIQLERRVTAMKWDDARHLWQLSFNNSDTDRITAQFVISAMGCLSTSRIPDIPGLESFQGEAYHTGTWPKTKVEFTGKNVAVIGTGSSGIQSIPLIAKEAKHLTVFQRTPSFSVPAQNYQLSDEEKQKAKETYVERRVAARNSTFGIALQLPADSALAASEEERLARYEEGWKKGGFHILFSSFGDLLLNQEANDTIAEFARAKIAATIKDSNVVDLITPRGYPFASKRLCVDTNYYDTYNRDNVTLVSVKSDPITEITPTGLIQANKHYQFDMIVFATGFDAMTGSLLRVDIQGKNGITIQQKWQDGPTANLGLSVAGFPNLFVVTGPLSPSVLTNMPLSIEQHVNWMVQLIKYLRENNLSVAEATEEGEVAWAEHSALVANMTLFPKANSWYVGANVPGKPKLFYPYAGGLQLYQTFLDKEAAEHYKTFQLY